MLGNPSTEVDGVATLDRAGPRDLGFLANSRYRDHVAASGAAAVVLGAADAVLTDRPRIVAPNPYLFFARVSALFHPEPAAVPGIHPSAWIDARASVSATAEVGPLCTVAAGAVVSDGVRVGAGAHVGERAFIGEATQLHANVSILADSRLGARCIVHSGAVVGSDGFGFARDGQRWMKIPQAGRVIIGDDVEIGANTTIDRGALDDTVIDKGVKLDNQIQVGHNVHIGENSALAGCVGIAGSARIGANCTIGGGAIILGHIRLCDGVHVSAGTLVDQSIDVPGTYTAVFPLLAHGRWGRVAALLRKLDELVNRVRKLERDSGTGGANMMDIHEILQYLPHRYPMLLVDRVLEVEPGKRILAIKNVSINEPFFNGHFPHHPVMPGVLIVEALAQAAAILSFKTLDTKPDDKSVYYFVGIDEARFKRPVSPGDQLVLEVSIERNVRGIWKFAGEARVGDALAAEAKLMCTVRAL